jgi:hypothetical protein
MHVAPIGTPGTRHLIVIASAIRVAVESSATVLHPLQVIMLRPETVTLLVSRRIFIRDPDRANLRLSSETHCFARLGPAGAARNVFIAPGRRSHANRASRRSLVIPAMSA